MKRIRRILHATDFSRASRAAFTAAIDLARSTRAELVIFHAIDTVIPMGPDGYMPPQMLEDILASARTHADRQLASLVARARKAGVRAKSAVGEGLAVDQIVRAGRSADLIVMGTHGRSGMARLFLGSVAARVIASASRPVLTVRGRREPGRKGRA